MRYSKQRNLILAIIRENPVHPTAEWVFQKAKEAMPGIGIATVYRNLNALVAAGEIEKLTGVDGVDRFDSNHGHHYHLRCSQCGSLFDLEASSDSALNRMEAVIKETFPAENVEISINTMLLEGTCVHCSSGRK